MISRYRSSRPAMASAPLDREETLGGRERLDERVDVGFVVVDVERRSGGGGNAEDAHQGLRAVMPGPDADPVLVDDLGDVVGVDALEQERDRRSPPFHVGGTVDRQAVPEPLLEGPK